MTNVKIYDKEAVKVEKYTKEHDVLFADIFEYFMFNFEEYLKNYLSDEE